MKNRFIWTGIITLIVGLSMVGCYTIIKHPVVEEEEYSAAYYHRHCVDCHEDYVEYPYGYYYGYYPDYYWDYPRWGKYYAYPWWWDWHWWPQDEYAPEEEEKAERRRREDTLMPPYTPAPQINAPAIVPTPGTYDQNIEKKTQEKKQEKESVEKEKKEKEKAPRRRTDEKK